MNPLKLSDNLRSASGQRDAPLHERFIPVIVPGEPFTARSISDLNMLSSCEVFGNSVRVNDRVVNEHRRTNSIQSVEKKCTRNISVDKDFEDKSPSLWLSVQRLARSLVHTISMMGLFLSLTWKDFKERPCTYVLGFTAVFVVVSVAIVMLAVLGYMPLAFLQLADTQQGQTDLIIEPGGLLGEYPSINYTRVKEYFPPFANDQGYHAPRVIFELDASNTKSCQFSDHDGLSRDCLGIATHSVKIFVVDSELENKIGLGVSSNPQLNAGEVIISDHFAQILNISVGDTLSLSGWVGSVLDAAYYAGRMTPQDYIDINPQIKAIVGPDDNRFPAEVTFVILDYSNFFKTIANSREHAGSHIYDQEASLTLDSGVSQVIFNMPTTLRASVYRSSNYNSIRYNFALWAQKIILPIGLTQISTLTPVLTFLYKLRMFNMFIGLIMSLVIISLGFLCTVLIYSLLSVGVETRTYTIGIQRMLGFTRSNMVFLLLINVFTFTILGCIFGIFAGQGLYLLVRYYFAKTTGIPMPAIVSATAVIVGSLTGVGVSFLAALFPARSIILLRLAEALDAARPKISGVTFKVHRRGKEGVNVKLTLFGLLCGVIGFLVYYVFPVSIFTMNLQVMFYFFFCMLIVLLTGCVLLMLNFERPIQSAISYLFFFWETKAVFRIVQMNLTAHRLDNRRTTLMFAMSMAFIIFLSVAFRTQISTLKLTFTAQFGGDMVVSIQWMTVRDLGKILRDLKKELSASTVSGITYVVQEQYNVAGSCTLNYTLQTLGRYVSANVHLVPLPPNFYEIASHNYLTVDRHTDVANKYGLSGALYSREGMSSVIMSSAAYDLLQLTRPSSTAIMRTKSNCGSYIEGRMPIQTVAALSSSPVVQMSTTVGTYGDVVSSLPNVVRMSGAPGASVNGLLINRLVLRVPDHRNFGSLKQNISKFLSTRDVSYSVDTINNVAPGADVASGIINKFFYLIEFIVLWICLLSLTSSQTSNILRSSKEIAIYRCLGMTNFQVYRIYVWGSFILVLTSSLMGLLVGVIVASTMSIQNILYAAQTSQMDFPYIQLIIIIALGIIFAIITGVTPVTFLLSLPSIAHMLRRSFS